MIGNGNEMKGKKKREQRNMLWKGKLEKSGRAVMENGCRRERIGEVLQMAEKGKEKGDIVLHCGREDR